MWVGKLSRFAVRYTTWNLPKMAGWIGAGNIPIMAVEARKLSHNARQLQCTPQVVLDHNYLVQRFTASWPRLLCTLLEWGIRGRLNRGWIFTRIYSRFFDENAIFLVASEGFEGVKFMPQLHYASSIESPAPNASTMPKRRQNEK